MKYIGICHSSNVKYRVDIIIILLYILYINYKLLYNRKGGAIMEMYREAYEYYKTTCERYGMDSVSFYQFVKHLTEEQLDEYCKEAI